MRRSPRARGSREAEVALRPGRLAGYATGSIGTGVFNTVPSVLLLFYMTDTLALAPVLAATALLIPKIWAMMFDPLVGALSDRTQSRWGRRRPWLLAGALALTLSFAFVFRAPVSGPVALRYGWVLGAYFVSATAYSMFAVPYVAMPSEMSPSPAVRTTILSWRMSFVILGVLAGSAAGPALVQAFGGHSQGYAGMGLALAILIGVATLTAVASVGQLDSPSESLEPPSRFGEEIGMVLRDRLLRQLGAGFLLQGVATSITSAVLPYAVTHVLGAASGLVGPLFLLLIVSGLAFIPVWARIARRFGKRSAFVAAALCSAGMSLTLLGLQPGYSRALLYGQFLLMGFGFAGLQVLPFTMLTDVVQNDGLARGGRREGLYTGVWTATEKLGLALGPMVLAGCLAAGGYVQSAGGNAVQPPAAVWAIRVALAALPALLFAASALVIRRYPLTEAALESMASPVPNGG